MNFYFGPTVHTLRISLNDVESEVWRRVVVESDTPLPMLAHILERVMGWQGHHLHLFDARGILFGQVDDDFETDHLIDENAANVGHLLPGEGDTMRWDYDFGDGWEHQIVAESIGEPTEGQRLPICLDGANACPPEDCGGPHGYADLLAVLADPKHPDHAHLKSWAPKNFDPTKFDLKVANRLLMARG